MTRGQPRAQVETDPGLIARKLQFLFDTVQKPDGSRYTYREVIDGIQARGGPKISAGYLSQLVTGIRSRPMMDTVQGLARFFDVPVTYFSPMRRPRQPTMTWNSQQLCAPSASRTWHCARQASTRRT